MKAQVTPDVKTQMPPSDLNKFGTLWVNQVVYMRFIGIMGLNVCSQRITHYLFLL